MHVLTNAARREGEPAGAGEEPAVAGRAGGRAPAEHVAAVEPVGLRHELEAERALADLLRLDDRHHPPQEREVDRAGRRPAHRRGRR